MKAQQSLRLTLVGLVLVANPASADRLCVSIDEITSQSDKYEYRIYHDADARPVRATKTYSATKNRGALVFTNEATYANGRIVKLKGTGNGRPTTRSFRYDDRGLLSVMHLDTNGDGKPDEGATYVWKGKVLPVALPPDRPSSERLWSLHPDFGYVPLAFHGVVEERYDRMWSGPRDFDWTRTYQTDASGRITRMSYWRGNTAAGPADRVTSYKRVRVGAVLELTQDPIEPLLERETFAYTDDGKLGVHRTFRNGQEFERAESRYDAQGRLTERRHLRDGKLLSTETWTYSCP